MTIVSGRLFRTTGFRLALTYMALFGVGVVVLFGFLYWRTLTLIDRETDAAIESEIAGLAAQYNQQGLGGLVGIVAERASAQREGPNVYLLTRSDLTPLAGNIERWPNEARRTPAGIVFDIAGDTGAVNARAQVFLLEGGYLLLVGRDLRQRAMLRQLLAETLASGLAVTIGLGLIGALIVGRNLLSRVETINRTGQRIMRGDLHERVALRGGGDEFDRLAENLNTMLDQIERLMLAMREVTDNIAHDLRGPLTRMKARLELALLAGDKPEDVAQYRAAIETAIAETDRLLSTFNALLSIAEAESGALHQAMQPVDLAQLAEDVAELYAPALEEKGLTLETRIVECPRVLGSRQLLFQAIANLLENAMKYTPSGGRVTIATRPTGTGGSAAVEVGDSGPGIPAEMREKVLQRYVRLDQARTTPGSGLGLSLVAAVAKLHAAQLQLGDNNPGLVVTLEFPRGIRVDAPPTAGPARSRDDKCTDNT